jgi:hypothetical protein
MSCLCYGARLIRPTQNQRRDLGDCSHRLHNYDGTVRRFWYSSVARITSSRFCERIRRSVAAGDARLAWQNTSTVSSSVMSVSPLSTPIHRKTERGVASPFDCHSDVSFLSAKIYRHQLGFRDTCRESDNRECKAKSTREWRSPQSSWR